MAELSRSMASDCTYMFEAMELLHSLFAALALSVILDYF